MSKWAFLSSGTGVTVGAGAVVTAGVVTAAYVSGAFTGTDRADVPVAEPAALVQSESVAVAEPSAALQPSDSQADAAKLPEVPATEKLSFDLVRVEQDGSAMIAGQGDAGSMIAIRVDETIVAQAKVGRDGKFASFISLQDSASPRVMTLLSESGQQSLDQVIIAPVAPAQVPVAEAPPTEIAPAEQIAAVSEDAVPAQAQPVLQTAPLRDPATDPKPDTVPAAKPQDAVVLEQPAKTPAPQVVATSEPVVTNPDKPAKPAPQVAEPAVPATPAPTVLLANEEGVRVLQSAKAPKTEAMTALLDTISYDAQGEVALTGRGEGQFVRVYLDNAPITTSRITPSGDWRAELPAVDTGIYTLRVDELNDEGNVVARVETPFKREDAEVLAAATEPDALVQAITVQPGATLWALARERYGDGTLYTRVFDANREVIRDPNLIYPGQVFNLPN